jgi:anti-sigma-K factor RskA
MFGSIRYRNPEIRDYLANQYAMGLLTPLVKKRVEAFIDFDPSFQQEVVAWQERLAPLNNLPASVPAPDYVRRNLLAFIGGTKSTKPIIKWWQSLRVWQAITMCSLMLFTLISFQALRQTETPIQRLAYVAVMQSEDTAVEAPLIISAYKKSDQAPSRLELRWNDRQPSVEVAGATLWAIERETGDVHRLTTLADDTNRVDLTADQWLSVQNSLELIVTAGTDVDSPVVLRGFCLQLTDWEAT